MSTILETFNQAQLRKDLPDICPGDTIRVYQEIKEGGKDLPAGRQGRVQIFEGQVLCRKHGKGIASTITVRKVISGIGVERIFPVHSPTIKKIEVLKRGKVRRAKLYYLRKAKGKKARLKKKEVVEMAMTEEKPVEEKAEEIKTE